MTEERFRPFTPKQEVRVLRWIWTRVERLSPAGRRWLAGALADYRRRDP